MVRPCSRDINTISHIDLEVHCHPQQRWWTATVHTQSSLKHGKDGNKVKNCSTQSLPCINIKTRGTWTLQQCYLTWKSQIIAHYGCCCCCCCVWIGRPAIISPHIQYTTTAMFQQQQERTKKNKGTCKKQNEELLLPWCHLFFKSSNSLLH